MKMLLESRMKSKEKGEASEFKKNGNRFYPTLFFIILLGCCPLLLLGQEVSNSQRFSISTNVIDYINFATINAEGTFSMSKNLALTLSGKYNPFIYNKGKANQIQNKVLNVSLGVRYWPWFSNSSWFISGKLQGEIYNVGGSFISQTSREGHRVGTSIGAGYAIMISSQFNIEIGIGLWFGYERFSSYSCINCGNIVEQGNKLFIRPNNLIINLVYIFK